MSQLATFENIALLKLVDDFVLFFDFIQELPVHSYHRLPLLCSSPKNSKTLLNLWKTVEIYFPMWYPGSGVVLNLYRFRIFVPFLTFY